MCFVCAVARAFVAADTIYGAKQFPCLLLGHCAVGCWLLSFFLCSFHLLTRLLLFLQLLWICAVSRANCSSCCTYYAAFGSRGCMDIGFIWMWDHLPALLQTALQALDSRQGKVKRARSPIPIPIAILTPIPIPIINSSPRLNFNSSRKTILGRSQVQSRAESRPRQGSEQCDKRTSNKQTQLVNRHRKLCCFCR